MDSLELVSHMPSEYLWDRHDVLRVRQRSFLQSKIASNVALHALKCRLIVVARIGRGIPTIF